MTTITIPIDVAEAAAVIILSRTTAGRIQTCRQWTISILHRATKAIRAELAKPVELVELAAWRTCRRRGWLCSAHTKITRTTKNGGKSATHITRDGMSPLPAPTHPSMVRRARGCGCVKAERDEP